MVPVGWLLHPIPPRLIGEVVYLGIATQVAALMPLRWSRGQQTVDTLPLVAAGLLVPGGGVAILAWAFRFDGRRPTAEFPLWRLVFNRAKTALEHGIPSLLVAYVPMQGVWALPVRTLLLSLGTVAIGYPLVAGAVAFIDRVRLLEVLIDNVGLATLRSVLLLGFGGGVLFMLLQQPSGYLMAIGLLGFLWAVRTNMADVQRQAVSRVQTLELAAQALDARDTYTESHSLRVAELSVRIGSAMGMSSKQLDRLRTAGMLHDIGKIGIRDHVLNKPGPLSVDEWEQMKRHADMGADLIAKHSALADVAPMVRYHHERWDGSGYPSGLTSDAIPIGARILGVADSFDTMTGVRVYRSSVLNSHEATDQITRAAGNLYDPEVVAALRKVFGMSHSPWSEERSSDGASVPPRRGLRLIHERPAFRWLLLSMTISSLGDPMSTVASLVTVYAATRNPLAVAATYIVRAIATVLISGSISSLTDKLDRRRLIVVLEVFRALVLISLPVALHVGLWALFPALAALAAAQAIVQPAREAVVPELLRSGEARFGNAVIGAATNAATILGYPLAGLILLFGGSTTPLFLADAATFAVAGLVTIQVGSMGGGAVIARQFGAGLRVALRNSTVRPLLLVAGLAAFFMAMSFPTLILLGYQLSRSGAQAYTVLEAAVGSGIVVGSLLLGRFAFIRSGWLAALGLAIMALPSLILVLSSWFWVTAFLLFLSSAGNAFYTVSNRTDLQEAVDGSQRGSVMSSRFGVVQIMLIAGSGVGGWLASSVGPRLTYGVIGAGLLVAVALAVSVANVSRRPTSLVSAAVDKLRPAPIAPQVGYRSPQSVGIETGAPAWSDPMRTPPGESRFPVGQPKSSQP